jgi:hypothetical protein
MCVPGRPGLMPRSCATGSLEGSVRWVRGGRGGPGSAPPCPILWRHLLKLARKETLIRMTERSNTQLKTGLFTWLSNGGFRARSMRTARSACAPAYLAEQGIRRPREVELRSCARLWPSPRPGCAPAHVYASASLRSRRLAPARGRDHTDPASEPRCPPADLPEVLSPEEVERLLTACGGWARPIGATAP